MTISFTQENNQDISSYKEKETIAVLHGDTISKSYFDSVSSVPFQFVEKNNDMLYGKKEHIEKSLRNGEVLPVIPFSNDWTIGIIILSIMLFSIVYTSAKTLFSDIVNFFLFRKTTKEENKTTTLFRWELMLLNISSLFIISIFVYFIVFYSGIISGDLSGFKIWLFSMGIIVIAIILRHFICISVGVISGSIEIFNDYINAVYQIYRFSGFFLFILMILFFYTPLINAKNCFIIGCAIVAILYLIRILRLFILFINHKISIFYFILYFCALEILPVLILIKYFQN